MPLASVPSSGTWTKCQLIFIKAQIKINDMVIVVVYLRVRSQVYARFNLYTNRLQRHRKC